MGLYEEIRGQSKLDSRRFGKSIVCEIIHGDALDTINNSKAAIPGYNFSKNTGVDPRWSSLLAIPLDKLEEFRALLKSLRNTQTNIINYTKVARAPDITDIPAGQSPLISPLEEYSSSQEKDDAALKLIEEFNRRNILESALRKMVILVFVESINNSSGGAPGKSPQVYRVKIESIDVGQQVEGFYVRKNM